DPAGHAGVGGLITQMTSAGSSPSLTTRCGTEVRYSTPSPGSSTCGEAEPAGPRYTETRPWSTRRISWDSPWEYGSSPVEVPGSNSPAYTSTFCSGRWEIRYLRVPGAARNAGRAARRSTRWPASSSSLNRSATVRPSAVAMRRSMPMLALVRPRSSWLMKLGLAFASTSRPRTVMRRICRYARMRAPRRAVSGSVIEPSVCGTEQDVQCNGTDGTGLYKVQQQGRMSTLRPSLPLIPLVAPVHPQVRIVLRLRRRARRRGGVLHREVVRQHGRRRQPVTPGERAQRRVPDQQPPGPPHGHRPARDAHPPATPA